MQHFKCTNFRCAGFSRKVMVLAWFILYQQQQSKGPNLKFRSRQISLCTRVFTQIPSYQRMKTFQFHFTFKDILCSKSDLAFYGTFDHWWSHTSQLVSQSDFFCFLFLISVSLSNSSKTRETAITNKVCREISFQMWSETLFTVIGMLG